MSYRDRQDDRGHRSTPFLKSFATSRRVLLSLPRVESYDCALWLPKSPLFEALDYGVCGHCLAEATTEDLLKQPACSWELRVGAHVLFYFNHNYNETLPDLQLAASGLPCTTECCPIFGTKFPHGWGGRSSARNSNYLLVL